MPKFKLVSNDLCPFVQRSVIALAHKQVEFELVCIDIDARPDWFRELSPTGKIPMLVVTNSDGSEVAVFDSSIINEYINEVTGAKMLPDPPLERAKHRSMIELSSAALDDARSLANAVSEIEAHGYAGSLQDKLARLGAEVHGPFFAGDVLGLVDTAALPLLQRVAWLDQLVPELRLLEGLATLPAWLAAGLTLEAVSSSTDEDAARRYQQSLVDIGSWVGQRGKLRVTATPPPSLI